MFYDVVGILQHTQDDLESNFQELVGGKLINAVQENYDKLTEPDVLDLNNCVQVLHDYQEIISNKGKELEKQLKFHAGKSYIDEVRLVTRTFRNAISYSRHRLILSCSSLSEEDLAGLTFADIEPEE